MLHDYFVSGHLKQQTSSVSMLNEVFWYGMFCSKHQTMNQFIIPNFNINAVRLIITRSRNTVAIKAVHNFRQICYMLLSDCSRSSNHLGMLTILSLYQAEIHRRVNVINCSTHHTFIVWPLYLAKQTLLALLISVLSVLLYWLYIYRPSLHLSLDSIKMRCGWSSQMAMLDMSAAILDNSFKTSTPFIDTVIIKRCESFCHSVTLARSLQLFHSLELSLVVDSRLVAEEHPKQRNPRD